MECAEVSGEVSTEGIEVAVFACYHWGLRCITYRIKAIIRLKDLEKAAAAAGQFDDSIEKLVAEKYQSLDTVGCSHAILYDMLCTNSRSQTT